MQRQEKYNVPGQGDSSAGAKARNRTQSGHSLLLLRMRSLKPQKSKENAPMVTQLISSRTRICPKIPFFTHTLSGPQSLRFAPEGPETDCTLLRFQTTLRRYCLWVWELDLSPACAWLEQSQEPGQFPRLSCLAHPKEASASSHSTDAKVNH